MCFFPYPIHTPKSKKAKKTKSRSSSEDTRETTRKVVDEAVGQMFPTRSFYPTTTPIRTSPIHHGCEMDYWLEENRHSHVTKDQWDKHYETLRKTHDTAGDNGNKIDSLREAVCGEGEVARDAIGKTHDSVRDARGDIKDTQDAVRSTHDAIMSAQEDIKLTHEVITNTHNAVKDTQKTMKKNHREQNSKHVDCAAEVDKVRKLLEEDARKRDEAHQRQQTMQEAWNYVQWFRQADRDANQLSRSSSQSTSNRRSGSRRRHTASEDSHESERHRQREREAEESLVERLGKVLSEAEKANKDREKDREGDSRCYGYRPGSSPPQPDVSRGDYRGGSWHFFPSQNHYYDNFNTGDTGGYVPPYRRPFRSGGPADEPNWEQRLWHR